VARQHKPDWEILGKDPSGALLVARINHTAVHKCCPACFQQDTFNMVRIRFEHPKAYQSGGLRFCIQQIRLLPHTWYVAHDEFAENVSLVIPDETTVEPYSLPTWNDKDDDLRKGESLCLLFGGGLGDLVSLRPVLRWLRKRRDFGMIALGVPFMGPRWFCGLAETTFEYPTMLDRLTPFDRIVLFEGIFKDTMQRNLVDVFADYLGIGDAMAPEEKQPKLVPAQGAVEYVKGLLPPPRGKYVGIHFNATVPERSIPVATAVALARMIADAGHTAILIGTYKSSGRCGTAYTTCAGCYRARRS